MNQEDTQENTLQDLTLNEKAAIWRKEFRSRTRKNARKCKQCETRTHNQNFCSPDCRKIWIESRKSDKEYPIVGNLCIGAVSEHVVIADLLRRGYDIYSAASPGTVVDLIALNKGTRTLHTVQVKTGILNTSGKVVPHTRRTPPYPYDVLACVTKDGLVEYVPDLPPLVDGTALS